VSLSKRCTSNLANRQERCEPVDVIGAGTLCEPAPPRLVTSGPRNVEPYTREALISHSHVRRDAAHGPEKTALKSYEPGSVLRHDESIPRNGRSAWLSIPCFCRAWSGSRTVTSNPLPSCSSNLTPRQCSGGSRGCAGNRSGERYECSSQTAAMVDARRQALKGYAALVFAGLGTPG
jgi:hypothetical protein